MGRLPDGERPRHTCPWCGEPPTEEEAEWGVCGRRVRTLTYAGLSDEEIYGEKDKGDEKG